MARPDIDAPMPEGLENAVDDWIAYVQQSAEMLLAIDADALMTWLASVSRYLSVDYSLSERRDASTRLVEVDFCGPWGIHFTLELRPLSSNRTLLSAHFWDGSRGMYDDYQRLLNDAHCLFGPNSDGVHYMPESWATPVAASNATPRVPTRPKDRARWQATWRAVRGMWGDKSYPDMLQWLQRMHGELVCSERTLGDIGKAGDAGLLD